MKKRQSILTAVILLSGFAFLTQSCEINPGGLFSGREVKFKASTAWNGSVATKTVYVGELVEVETKTSYSGQVYSGYERIDWVEGDLIGIYSPQLTRPSSDNHEAKYIVQGVSGDSDRNSYATLGNADGNGLEWGEDAGSASFYAIYPYTKLEASDYNNFSLELPASQSCEPNAAATVWSPNMQRAFMFAAAKDISGPSAVSLAFKPLYTAFQFTIDSGDEAVLNVRSFTLSSASLAMAGSYRAAITAAEITDQSTVAYDFAAADAAGAKAITISFGSDGVSIQKGTPVTFTLFALPRTYSDLKVSLQTSLGGRSLELRKSNGEALAFQAGLKYNINLGGVPGEWIYYIDDPQPVTLTYEGGTAALHASNQFKSYRYRSGQSEPVPYKLQYSADNGSTWTDLPDWLSATSPGSFAGSVSGEALTLTVGAQANSATDAHAATLKSRDHKADFDLSTLNVATGETVERTTANCYVVGAPGTYKFPLVYGNGLEDGSINSTAYTGAPIPDDHTTDKRSFLTAFKDDADTDITESPYIESRKGTVTPVILWMDEPGLVTNVGRTGSGESAYFTFDVPEETICQGNALLAAVDGSGSIVWSWHIWVTDHDTELMQPVQGPTGYKLAQYNIGWCDGKVREQYDQRKCLIRAVQTDGEGNALASSAPSAHISGSAAVEQQSYRTIVRDNSPYYQWGRKDPLRASNGLSDGDEFGYKDLAYINETYPVGISKLEEGSTTSIGSSIRQPYLFYWAPQPAYHDWNTGTSMCNLWNSSLTTRDKVGSVGAAVTKTIYDPSPVGFKVGPMAAYNGFSAGNCSWVEKTELTVSKLRYGTTDLYFPAVGARPTTVGNDTAPKAVDRFGWFWTTSVQVQYDFVQSFETSSVAADNYNVWMNVSQNRPMGLSIRPVVDDAFSKGLIGTGEDVIWD